MPHVVEGCGTWYYGKKNVHQYEGYCNACNRLTTLTSYDTRLFVVIVMVPVIPLGRKRIIEECAACRHHHAMSLDVWRLAQQRAERARDAYCDSPHDAQLAEEALHMLIQYRDLSAFMMLAPEIEQNLRSDAKTLCLLAGAYDIFGQIEDTERLLRAALDVKNEEETREFLADCLLRQGQPEKAAPYLQHIIQKRIPDRMDLVYRLAQSYQTQGEHEKALAAFRQCEQINPPIRQDATFNQLREASEKNLGTHVKIEPAKMIKKTQRAASFRRFARIGFAAVFLAAIAYATLAWIQGMRREVYLVNGLERTYSVRLNGTSYTLQPGIVTSARLGEGDIEIEIEDAPLPVEHATVSVRTDFLSRPFANHTFVLNPDSTAILRRTRVYYSLEDDPRKCVQPQHSFIAGQILHQFTDIDYPFEDFPDSIDMDLHSDAVPRDGIYLVSKEEDYSTCTLLLFLSNDLGNDTVTHIAQQHLLFEPERSKYLHLLANRMKPEDLATFLRPGLKMCPLRIPWHRTYQSVMTRAGHEEEIEREYEVMLAEDPQNKDLLYLAARASTDIDKALSLCRQAITGDSPSAYAFFWLSGYHLTNGQFQEAAENAEKALQQIKEEDDVRSFCMESLIAAQRFQKVLDLLHNEQEKPIFSCLKAYRDEAYIHSLDGQQAEAQQTIERLRHRLEDTDPELAESQIRRVAAGLAYSSGNHTEFARLLLESSDPQDRVVAELTNGNLEAAEQEIQKLEPNAHLHLLLYLAAISQQQQAIADRYMESAVNMLAKGSYADRTFAQAIKEGVSSADNNLLRLWQSPQVKAVLLTVVGLRDPTNRAACFSLARALNYDKRFPHLLLKQVLDTQPAP